MSGRLSIVSFPVLRYEQLSRICPDEEAYKLYFAQALYKVRTGSLLLFAVFMACLDMKQKPSCTHATSAVLSAQHVELCNLLGQQQSCLHIQVQAAATHQMCP